MSTAACDAPPSAHPTMFTSARRASCTTSAGMSSGRLAVSQPARSSVVPMAGIGSRPPGRRRAAPLTRARNVPEATPAVADVTGAATWRSSAPPASVVSRRRISAPASRAPRELIARRLTRPEDERPHARSADSARIAAMSRRETPPQRGQHERRPRLAPAARRAPRARHVGSSRRGDHRGAQWRRATPSSRARAARRERPRTRSRRDEVVGTPRGTSADGVLGGRPGSSMPRADVARRPDRGAPSEHGERRARTRRARAAANRRSEARAAATNPDRCGRDVSAQPPADRQCVRPEDVSRARSGSTDQPARPRGRPCGARRRRAAGARGRPSRSSRHRPPRHSQLRRRPARRSPRARARPRATAPCSFSLATKRGSAFSPQSVERYTRSGSTCSSTLWIRSTISSSVSM